jgi:hypothetical protein
MTGFFQTAAPATEDILLIESGSQEVFRRGLASVRRTFPQARLHLLTCWPDPPPGAFERIHQVRNYASRRDKLQLLWALRKEPPNVVAVLCSKEPVMASWKVLAVIVLPSKALIINENGDFFWLDWRNLRALRQFLETRWTILGKDFLLTALRAVVFPLTVLFLLANALRLYLRRWRRLLLGMFRGGSARHEGTGLPW